MENTERRETEYNEIIKALEEILNREYREDIVPTAIATIEFFKCVYNLICRQNSKIEALQMVYNQLRSDNINANQNHDHITNLWEVEKEKVEKAKQKVINVCKELQTAKAEIERLTEHNNTLINRVDDLVYKCDCIKQEAIKEFAERFEDELGEDLINYYPHILTVLDNLVEEMTEGEKE